MTEGVKEKVYNRAQDYYKMLLFLNESTNDSFLLWDMESDIVYFSQQLSVLDGREHREGISDGIFAYGLDAIKAVVYKNDMGRVEQALRHMRKGSEDRMDILSGRQGISFSVG